MLLLKQQNLKNLILNSYNLKRLSGKQEGDDLNFIKKGKIFVGYLFIGAGLGIFFGHFIGGLFLGFGMGLVLGEVFGR